MTMQAIGSSIGTAPVSKQQLPPIKREKVEVDASYRPADMEIRTRNVEMDAKWEPVYEELGYLRPSSQAKELSAKAKQEASQAILSYVHEGLRIRNIHSDKGNVYGSIAFNKFRESMKAHVQLMALPKFGLQIDVRIYPPEIKVTPHIRGVSD